MSPAKVPEGSKRGWIIPIGGAEQKERSPVILERFVQLAGGRDARIAVIPTASKLEDTGDRYRALFRELGAGEILLLDFDTRRDAFEKGRIAELEECDGVFITGGNQLRLSTMLGGTDISRKIREMNARGVHVCGTSAGASFLSEHMIAFGEDNVTPHARSVTLAPGLGLTNRVVIDQHFTQRNRLGRLITALAFNPFLIGLGLDEDTAAFIAPDQTVEVEGSGTLTVVDADHLKFSSMDQAGPEDPVSMLGLTLHVLIRGATFNLHTRKASAGALAVDKA
ncbi:MAG: cyanophycinase [Gemmatimonadales bacterium]|nr:cyanophycinase [Gemmatimonadota bacterium]MCL4214537.1 cyanophycinase [Gemmatimonadales bacterium]